MLSLVVDMQTILKMNLKKFSATSSKVHDCRPENKLWQEQNYKTYRVGLLGFIFEQSVISNLAILILFHLDTKYCILSLLNEINPFTLELRWRLLGQWETSRWRWFCNKLSFRMNIIFILVGTLVSKIDVFGAQMMTI